MSLKMVDKQITCYCVSGNIFTPNNLSLPNICVGFTFMYLIAYL